MPTCPGCERTVAYDRLDAHQRRCAGLWGSAPVVARAGRRLDQRLLAVEDRLGTIEAEVTRWLATEDSTGGESRWRE